MKFIESLICGFSLVVVVMILVVIIQVICEIGNELIRAGLAIVFLSLITSCYIYFIYR